MHELPVALPFSPASFSGPQVLYFLGLDRAHGFTRDLSKYGHELVDVYPIVSSDFGNIENISYVKILTQMEASQACCENEDLL